MDILEYKRYVLNRNSGGGWIEANLELSTI